MILEGANKLKEDNEYVIQAINSATAGQYCIVMPKNVDTTLNMLIDLHQKTLFDEVSSGAKTMDVLLTELTEEYQKVKEKNPNGLLVVPMLDENEFASTVNNLDKQKIFDETKKIGAITSELYKKLTAAGLDKQKINQKIMILEKKDEDVKYINWLKEQMPNFVEGVSLTQAPAEQPTPAPTANVDIFGAPSTPEPTPAPVTPEPVPETPVQEAPTNNGIFDNQPAPVQETTQAEPAPATPVEMPTLETPPVEEKKEEPVNQDVDIFGIPASQPAAPAAPSPQQPVEPAPAPTEAKPEEPNQFFEAPQPVQNVELEGTTTFSPIPNTEAPQSENNAAGEPPKKNGGFVNLAILLVILIVVTIVSIELGKFLYSVYGA